jgi:hypothetical protein
MQRKIHTWIMRDGTAAPKDDPAITIPVATPRRLWNHWEGIANTIGSNKPQPSPCMTPYTYLLLIRIMLD